MFDVIHESRTPCNFYYVVRVIKIFGITIERRVRIVKVVFASCALCNRARMCAYVFAHVVLAYLVRGANFRWCVLESDFKSAFFL